MKRILITGGAGFFWFYFYDIWYCAKAETNERIKK